MVATLDLQVEVVGCPTVCRHCWAQGVPAAVVLAGVDALIVSTDHATT